MASRCFTGENAPTPKQVFEIGKILTGRVVWAKFDRLTIQSMIRRPKELAGVVELAMQRLANPQLKIGAHGHEVWRTVNLPANKTIKEYIPDSLDSGVANVRLYLAVYKKGFELPQLRTPICIRLAMLRIRDLMIGSTPTVENVLHCVDSLGGKMCPPHVAFELPSNCVESGDFLLVAMKPRRIDGSKHNPVILGLQRGNTPNSSFISQKENTDMMERDDLVVFRV